MSVSNTNLGAAGIAAALQGKKRIWFIGIGGVHMAAIALACRRRGFAVAGSDLCDSPRLQQLAKKGIPVYIGQDPERVKEFDAAVYTLAISPEDPEYLAAIGQGMPVFSRADFLSFLVGDYARRIGVAGSHGKSTVTAMLSEIFVAEQRFPTVFCGAELPRVGGTSLVGKGEDCIFEACEYGDSFLAFSPTVSLLLNVEMDHTDYFSDLDALVRSFAAFAAAPGALGTVLYNAEDENCVSAVADSPAHKFSFGLTRGDCHAVHLQYVNGKGKFLLCLMDRICGEVQLSVMGEHNVKNALAAALCASLSGIPTNVILQALSHFKGAARRMEYRGMHRGVCYYDDYAHHPTEVSATLSTLRTLCGKEGRLFAVFQPHTYTRTAAFFEEFCRALRLADHVLVADIYPARETDTLGMSAALLAEGIGTRAEYVGDDRAIAAALRDKTQPGDTVAVMGAGNIDAIFAEILPKDFTLSEK